MIPTVCATCVILQAFCDLEAFYTYEGTYDINVLVAGRGATGIAAIKAPAAANNKSKSRAGDSHVQA